VREVLWFIGMPAVTASIVTLPSSVGLLIPLRYALMDQLRPMQPPATDIIRFAVRECFDPVRFKELIVDYPSAEYDEAMGREGYSAKWAQMFWGAHWVLPPIGALNEMLYRNHITADTYLKYLRYHDYEPMMRENLMKIIYHPYTRVDLRRMWELRTVDEQTMLREYKWLGYDDEHALGMVLWTKVYVAIPDLTAKYRNGWINSDELMDELLATGLSAEKAYDLWQQIVKRSSVERVADERNLTKTNVLKLLRFKEINDTQAKSMLMSLGYDETEASYLVVLEKDRAADQLKDLSTSQILKTYTYGIKTRDETKSSLIAAGWSEASAETLLELEDVKRSDHQTEKMRERDLSITQIRDAIRAGIIDLTTGAQYLSYLGYSDWEIDVLLKLWGLV
jgi:hypothetical protein